MAEIQNNIKLFEENNIKVFGISSDSKLAVTAMKMTESISFPLVSNVKLMKYLGLENENMNRAPVVAILGKNLVKYWVYEGVNASDRPTSNDILDQSIRVIKIYK